MFESSSIYKLFLNFLNKNKIIIFKLNLHTYTKVYFSKTSGDTATSETPVNDQLLFTKYLSFHNTVKHLLNSLGLREKYSIMITKDFLSVLRYIYLAKSNE